MRHPRLRHAAVPLVLVLLAACSSGAAGAHLPESGSPTLSAVQRGSEDEPVSTRPGVLAAALPGVVAPRCVNATSGWLAREQSLPGHVVVPGTRQAPRASDTRVQGYLDRTYAVCGETIGVHLAATVPTRVVVQAIRVGDYHGFTGRLVWNSAPVEALPRPHLPATPHVTQDNNWPTTLTLTPRASWAPGLYVVRFHAPDGNAPDTYQPLYVLTSGEHARYLAIGSDLTQLAYDHAGGSSLYWGPGATDATRRADRAYVASTHRALAGSGESQLLSMDVPLAVVLGRHHVTADWTSDMSLDANPAQVDGYATILIPGHSEYWTRRNYDTLSTAVARGTNLAVLGANELYWQTRLRRDSAGSVASMTVYRSGTLDPAALAADKTTQWRDAPLRRDPAALTGLGMSGVGIEGSGTVVSTPPWLFHGTGLSVGMVLPHMYGNEGDGPTDPHDPADTQVLFRSLATTTHHTQVVLATAYHVASSGAGVFNAGTTEWLCSIVDMCGSSTRTNEVRHALDQLTGNLLAAFSAPRAGLLHPSVPDHGAAAAVAPASGRSTVSAGRVPPAGGRRPPRRAL